MDVGPSAHTCPFPRVSVVVVQGAGDLNRTYGSLLTTSSLVWALRRGRCCGTVTRPHLSGAPEVPPDGVSHGKLQQSLLPPPTPSVPPVLEPSTHTRDGTRADWPCVVLATDLTAPQLSVRQLAQRACHPKHKERVHTQLCCGLTVVRSQSEHSLGPGSASVW